MHLFQTLISISVSITLLVHIKLYRNNVIKIYIFREALWQWFRTKVEIWMNATSTFTGCVWSRVQPRGGPQEGICNGVQNSRCPGNIRKIYIKCSHPHKPEPGGMGHMEQGHSELFWVARALQLTPGTVI